VFDDAWLAWQNEARLWKDCVPSTQGRRVA